MGEELLLVPSSSSDPERRHGDRDDEEVKVNKWSGGACISERFGSSTLRLRRRRRWRWEGEDLGGKPAVSRPGRRGASGPQGARGTASPPISTGTGNTRGTEERPCQTPWRGRSGGSRWQCDKMRTRGDSTDTLTAAACMEWWWKMPWSPRVSVCDERVKLLACLFCSALRLRSALPGLASKN